MTPLAGVKLWGARPSAPYRWPKGAGSPTSSTTLFGGTSAEVAKGKGVEAKLAAAGATGEKNREFDGEPLLKATQGGA